MTLFGIKVSINVIDKSVEIIYGTYLNENFFLIKINKPPPNNFNNVQIIVISISVQE